MRSQQQTENLSSTSPRVSVCDLRPLLYRQNRECDKNEAGEFIKPWLAIESRIVNVNNTFQMGVGLTHQPLIAPRYNLFANTNSGDTNARAHTHTHTCMKLFIVYICLKNKYIQIVEDAVFLFLELSGFTLVSIQSAII